MLDNDSYSLSEDSDGDDQLDSLQQRQDQQQQQQQQQGESANASVGDDDGGDPADKSGLTAEEREALRKARRRKNNRESARRVRARKMEEFTVLQEKVKAAVTAHKELSSTCIKLQQDKQQLESKKILMEVEHQVLASTNAALREHVAAVSGRPPSAAVNAVNARSNTIYEEARRIALGLLDNEDAAAKPLPALPGATTGGPSAGPREAGGSGAALAAAAASADGSGNHPDAVVGAAVGAAAAAGSLMVPRGARHELVLDLRGDPAAGGPRGELALPLWQRPAAPAAAVLHGGAAAAAPEAAPRPPQLREGAVVQVQQRLMGRGGAVELGGHGAQALVPQVGDPAGLLQQHRGAPQLKQEPRGVAYSQFATDGMYISLEPEPEPRPQLQQLPRLLPSSNLWRHLQPVELHSLAAAEYPPRLDTAGAVGLSQMPHVAFGGQPFPRGGDSHSLLRLRALGMESALHPREQLQQHHQLQHQQLQEQQRQEAGHLLLHERQQHAALQAALHRDAALSGIVVDGGHRAGFLSGSGADGGRGPGTGLLFDALEDRSLAPSSVLHLPHTRSVPYRGAVMLPPHDHSSYTLSSAHFPPPTTSAMLHLGSSHEGPAHAPHQFLSRDQGL